MLLNFWFLSSSLWVFWSSLISLSQRAKKIKNMLTHHFLIISNSSLGHVNLLLTTDWKWINHLNAWCLSMKVELCTLLHQFACLLIGRDNTIINSNGTVLNWTQKREEKIPKLSQERQNITVRNFASAKRLITNSHTHRWLVEKIFQNSHPMIFSNSLMNFYNECSSAQMRNYLSK